MPGLHELELFREELTRLGDERAVAAERGETFEELPLPEESTASAPDVDVDDLISSLGGDVPAGFEPESGPEMAAEPTGDSESSYDASFGQPFDPDAGFSPESESAVDTSSLDDLLASLDLGDGSALDTDSGLSFDNPAMPERADFGASANQQDASFPDSPDATDDFSIPDALLTGFADEVEAERASLPDSFGEEPMPGNFEAPSFPDGLEDLDEPEALEDLGSIGQSEPSAPVDAIAGLDALMEKGFSDAEESLEMDFTPDFEGIQRASVADSPGEDAPGEDAPVELSMDDALASMGLGEADSAFPSMEDIPGESAMDAGDSAPSVPAPADFSFPDDFSDLSLPETFSLPGEGANSGEGESASGIDGFEGFSLDDDFLKNTIDNVGDEEFHIPGFADFASGSADQVLSDISAASRSSGKKEIPLHISDEEFERLFAMLAKYPLNLRIGIEEFIAGDAGTELQKMEIVSAILRETPLRKIARNISDALGRTIEVPKDFEKKSFSEYQEEKASLRYVFFNRILPIFTIASIAAVLLTCVVYLSWQFVYRPIAAEILYNRGYTAIENELYSQSQDLFNQAAAKWEKKGWYFKYARAYRDHRQYLLAERMYVALLARYDNDKEAGLEYARMLLDDLRNFEKAETVLRRKVLDNYVNDSDGLMLLGDTYLEWADEDPSKFEEARKSYAILIELYGNKDPYLARMMRYFIRTDNLAEVLPLKDHFLAKSAKIGASDLVELGGYLVDKRYEPKPGDSAVLQDQIEDLRRVLERAVDTDDSIPEAHYNMGRFMIYNYDPDLAYRALDEARSLFDKAEVMTPRRVLTRVDTYRLLGELRADKGEYLDALDLYSQGMDIYERQRENGSVPQDRRVGLLYADSADIDYFLVDGHGDARAKYRTAIAELNDTPSIRYRIGVLDYLAGDYGAAYDSFTVAHADVPGDRSVLYSLANTLMKRDDVYLAQGYYELLMGSLDAERLRKGISFPSPRVDFRDFVEEYVRATNNLAVSLYRIAERSGDSRKYARAGALFSESIRASDSLTRDPVSVLRSDAQALAALNLRNMTHPKSGYVPEIYVDIPQLMQGEQPLRQREDE